MAVEDTFSHFPSPISQFPATNATKKGRSCPVLFFLSRFFLFDAEKKEEAIGLFPFSFSAISSVALFFHHLFTVCVRLGRCGSCAISWLDGRTDGWLNGRPPSKRGKEKLWQRLFLCLALLSSLCSFFVVKEESEGNGLDEEEEEDSVSQFPACFYIRFWWMESNLDNFSYPFGQRRTTNVRKEIRRSRRNLNRDLLCSFSLFSLFSRSRIFSLPSWSRDLFPPH